MLGYIKILLLLLWSVSTYALPVHNASAAAIILVKATGIKSNGVFKAKVLQDHVRALETKYSQNAANYFANTGRTLKEASNATQTDFQKNGLSRLNEMLTTGSPDQPKIAKRQSLPITSQKGLLWTGILSIGSNSQEFIIDFDTGSSDLWVPSVTCGTECSTHNKFSAKNSRTAREQDQSFAITYADGSTSSGQACLDTVHLARLTVTSQTFAQIHTAYDSYTTDPFDGIAGMAFETMSQLRAAPFFATLVNQGRVSQPIFAFRLAATNAELYLGGVNPDRFVGEIEFSPVDSDAYWSAEGTVQVAGTDVMRRSLIVDTGSNLIIAPSNEAAYFWSQVDGVTESRDYPGYYTYACDKPPQVSFAFAADGASSWALDPSTLNLGSIGPNECVASVIGADLGITSWILGDAFLLNVYAVFDLGGARLGFAKPSR